MRKWVKAAMVVMGVLALGSLVVAQEQITLRFGNCLAK